MIGWRWRSTGGGCSCRYTREASVADSHAADIAPQHALSQSWASSTPAALVSLKLPIVHDVDGLKGVVAVTGEGPAGFEDLAVVDPHTRRTRVNLTESDIEVQEKRKQRGSGDQMPHFFSVTRMD